MENCKSEYDLLIEKIEFEKIEMVRSSAKSNKMLQERNHTSPKNAKVKIKFSTKEFDISGNFFLVPVSFEVEATLDKDKNDNEKLFSIDFEMILYYSIKDISSQVDNKELLDKFIENNVPINFWPYAREYVSDLTVRMGFPPLYIPMFKQYNR